MPTLNVVANVSVMWGVLLCLLVHPMMTFRYKSNLPFGMAHPGDIAESGLLSSVPLPVHILSFLSWAGRETGGVNLRTPTLFVFFCICQHPLLSAI
jgi:hypothetical protein